MVDTLDRLPQGFVIVALPGAWFVAGEPGVYVVASESEGHGDESRGGDDEAVGRLAARVRGVLAQHLSWVPFVHALLVAERRRPVPAATAVPGDLLFDVLTEGRPSLGAETLGRIAELADRGLLAEAARPRSDVSG